MTNSLSSGSTGKGTLATLGNPGRSGRRCIGGANFCCHGFVSRAPKTSAHNHGSRV